MGVKLSSIKNLMLDPMVPMGIHSARPAGKNTIMIIALANKALTAQGEREIGINREKLADIIEPFLRLKNSYSVMSRECHRADRREKSLHLADAIISKLHEIIEYRGGK